MKCVALIGWKSGLKQISLAQLIKALPNYNLKLAHEALNRLMLGGTVELWIEESQVRSFVEAAERIGAICEIRADS